MRRVDCTLRAVYGITTTVPYFEFSAFQTEYKILCVGLLFIFLHLFSA